MDGRCCRSPSPLQALLGLQHPSAGELQQPFSIAIMRCLSAFFRGSCRRLCLISSPGNSLAFLHCLIILSTVKLAHKVEGFILISSDTCAIAFPSKSHHFPTALPLLFSFPQIVGKAQETSILYILFLNKISWEWVLLERFYFD